LVALGSPEDYLPPLDGDAVRTYADDESWYEYFERIAGRAVCIVMLVSHSDNLQQELTFIRRAGLQRRLFIFTNLLEEIKSPFAPLFRGLRLAAPIVSRPPAGIGGGLATWEHFAENLGKLGFDLGDNPGRGAVVTFDSGGKAMVLVRGAETPQGPARGDATSMSNLGALYHNGQGVARDYVKAREWYEKAADKPRSGAR
jgi:TPR repeat protein